MPPQQAPNVLLISTDAAGFGAPSTFGGVIPTPHGSHRQGGAAVQAHVLPGVVLPHPRLRLGGLNQNMVVSWPARIKYKGALRHQFVHVIDVVPTILEAAGLQAPKAARLVQRKVLLAPERTTCSVSAQAMAAMPTAMVTVTAYGDTLMLSIQAVEGMEMVDRGAGEEKQESSRKAPGFNPFRLF